MGGNIPKSYYFNHNQTSNQIQPDGKDFLLFKGRSKEFLEIRVLEGLTQFSSNEKTSEKAKAKFYIY